MKMKFIFCLLILAVIYLECEAKKNNGNKFGHMKKKKKDKVPPSCQFQCGEAPGEPTIGVYNCDCTCPTLDCPSPFTSVPRVGCVQVIGGDDADERTFDGARTACMALGGDLVSVESANGDTIAALRNWIVSEPHEYDVYVGLFRDPAVDDDLWNWVRGTDTVDGPNGVVPPLFPWSYEIDAGQDCVVIDSDGELFEDYCTRSIGYVCEFPVN